jgi:hypothetical protein
VPATKPAHCFFSLTAGPRPALLRLAPALDPLSLASHFTFETSSCKSFVVFPSPLSLRFNSILLSWDEATKQRELLFSFCQQTTNTKKVRYVFELLSTRHHNHPHMIIALLHTTLHRISACLPYLHIRSSKKAHLSPSNESRTSHAALSRSSTFPNQFFLPSHPNLSSSPQSPRIEASN